MAVCESKWLCTQPKDRASSVFPRYYLKIQLNESSARPGSLRNQGPFVVVEVRAAMLVLGKGEGSHLFNGVGLLGTSQVAQASACPTKSVNGIGCNSS